MNAKEFLRCHTIPRVAQAIPDFPYFSLNTIRADLRSYKMSVAPATLPRYLHDLIEDRIIFDAGRAWYSTLATPFSLNKKPIGELVKFVEKRFPFLNFSAWSTAQVAQYGHNLLTRFVTFVYADKDALESIADALRDEGRTVFVDPASSEVKKIFRINDKTVVLRPVISGGPTEGGYSAIEKIIVDLHVETGILNLMDRHELQRLTTNIVRENRVAIGSLVRYAENRRKIKLSSVIGFEIN